MLFRKLYIRFLLPLFWRISSRRRQAFFATFAVTELDSAWQSLNVIYKAKNLSAKMKKDLFSHAIEEINHSRVFKSAAYYQESYHPALPISERESLLNLDKKNPLVNFFSYAHVSEKSIANQFATYHSAMTNKFDKSCFNEVLVDEEHHAEFTKKDLAVLTKNNSWNIFKANCRRGYKAWVRLGEYMGQFTIAFIFSVIYFSFGIFMKLFTFKQAK